MTVVFTVEDGLLSADGNPPPINLNIAVEAEPPLSELAPPLTPGQALALEVAAGILDGTCPPAEAAQAWADLVGRLGLAAGSPLLTALQAQRQAR